MKTAWWPGEPMATPDDTWGVLGPTKCPFCRMLRKDPVFVCLWAGLIGLAMFSIWVESE